MGAITKIRNQPPAMPFDQQMELAKAFAESGLFGVQNKEQALALMALCEGEGLHPAIAVRDYHIIKGKPALKADAMLSRFQQAGGKVEWIELSDYKAAAKFSHPSGGSTTIDWDMERAHKAGFSGKDNWKKFPRSMLRSRVISEGIRTVYPGVNAGLYTEEEVQDFDDKPSYIEGEVIERSPEHESDLQALRELLLQSPAREAGLLKHYQVTQIEDLTHKQIQNAIGILSKTKTSTDTD